MAKKKTDRSCLLVASTSSDPRHRRARAAGATHSLPARRAIRVVVAGVVCAVMSSVAAADDELAPVNDTFSIGLTAGMFLPDQDVHDFYFETNSWQPLNAVGPALGLRLSYEPIRYAGIEIEGEVIPTGTDATDDSATMLGWRAQFFGEVPGRLTPFLLIGGGVMGIVSGDAVLGDDTDVIWHVGTGAKFYITSRWSVRLDGRWLLAPKREVMDGDDTVSHFLVTTSLTWRFGRSRSPAVTPRPDPDQDGVIGEVDRCPHDAGPAPDGCPAVAETDSDRDGILDSSDRCPKEPETRNEVDDKDGCPDTAPDQDGDGLADRSDRCVSAPEDLDAFQDEDGCPDVDNDNDGIPDGKDGCAQTRGPADNHGCPDKDGDDDGVVDRFDNCPTEMGSKEFSGCRTRQLVLISQGEIKVVENIYFTSGNAKIRTRSNSLLDNLAQVLIAHPEITRVNVEGHTDNRGDADRNKALSQRRAQAVVDYLAQKGVGAERLQALGHGEENPIADNRKPAGRSQNRRVEFRIERRAIASP